LTTRKWEKISWKSMSTYSTSEMCPFSTILLSKKSLNVSMLAPYKSVEISTLESSLQYANARTSILRESLQCWNRLPVSSINFYGKTTNYRKNTLKLKKRSPSIFSILRNSSRSSSRKLPRWSRIHWRRIPAIRMFWGNSKKSWMKDSLRILISSKSTKWP